MDERDDGSHEIETPFTGEEQPLLTDKDEDRKHLLESKKSEQESQDGTTKTEKWRNYVGFYLLGLCNNFPYVVMLSAAYDILSSLDDSEVDSNKGNSSCTAILNDTTNKTSYISRECLELGTYKILLADIVPTFLIKLIAPFFMHYIPYWIRVLAVVTFAIASFITVALGTNIIVVLSGVVFASISSGFGEITFLAFTALYDKFTVAGWSAGTGAAGVAGALIYTGLSTFLSPQNSILSLIIVPIILGLSYLFIIGKPKKVQQDSTNTANNEEQKDIDNSNEKDNGGGKTNQSTGKRRFKFEFFRRPQTSITEHLKFVPYLFFHYMIWLFLVYVAEYMINQSLFESLYYPNTHIDGYCLEQNVQYKWYQVTYQIGVFISRSSVSFFHIKFFHVMSLLQIINFVFLFLEVIYQFIPLFWITIIIVLYEGLLGGAVYANAFYAISKKIDPIHREFSMGLASAADSTGITLAGVLSAFVHNYICSLG